MSFIGAGHQGQTYTPGWFLVNNEDCSRFTKTIPQTLATTAEDGTKYVKMGTVFPANNSTAIGIVYEDVDVTTGAMPGSVVTKGEVYENRLADTLDSGAKTALEALGFVFVETEPTVTRPY